MARVDGAAAAVEDLCGLDVEELLVEAYAPEVAFGGGWAAAAGTGGVEEGGLVWLDFGAAVGVGVEGCVTEVRDGEGGNGRGGDVLELWNSRSSFRSVCPRSPCCLIQCCFISV